MARQVASVVENNFVNGLVTEATALNFPESACTETWNCVFEQSGPVSRRLGLDFEDNYAEKVINPSSKTVNTYLWTAVNGDGNLNFAVVQVGNLLYFYRTNSDGNISGGAFSGTIDLNTYRAGGAPPVTDTEAQFASGLGYLIVVHRHCDPFYVKFTAPSTFTATRLYLEVRDFEGVDDGYGTEELRASNTYPHLYNLMNQGWPQANVSSFQISTGKYPAHNIVWWLLKDALDVFTPSLYTTNTRGNSPAPKGKFTLKAFYQDRAAVSPGFPGLSVVSSGYQRPSTCEFYAGRVFYSGVSADGFSNKIYFSQIVVKPGDMAKCYQANDPTSEYSFDLLATDGGVINILDSGTIIKLFAIDGALIVFASNGVWSITGSTGMGFTALDYTIRKISTVPALSTSSFVNVSGIPAWWNTEGIYTLTMNSTTGQTQIVSMTEKKIKDFFNSDIPAGSKVYARGCYNPATRIVQWLYSSVNPGTVTARYSYDRILNFNVNTGAFYPWSFDDSGVKVHGLLCVLGSGSESVEEVVTDSSGVTVTDSGGNNVTVDVTVEDVHANTIKYFVSHNTDDVTWAEEQDREYKDWRSHTTDGYNYTSSFISGYKVRGDAMRKWQPLYIRIYCDNEYPSQFTIRSCWDYATTAGTLRWSTPQTVSMYTDDYDYMSRRLKLRGHGLSMQIKVDSIDGEPFDIIGWSTIDTTNAAP